jgi:hypothetical protein
LIEGKIMDKIELAFHDDDFLELSLINMLNKNSFKRSREYFIKDILVKYFEENCKEDFENIKNKYKEKIHSEKKTKS